jgi:hypothetical protein
MHMDRAPPPTTTHTHPPLQPTRIVGAAHPGQRHEVRHLPEVEAGAQDGGPHVQAPRRRCPAHERRHGAH